MQIYRIFLAQKFILKLTTKQKKLTQHQEEKRKTHTWDRTTRTPSSLPATRRHKAAVSAGLTRPRRGNRTILSAAGFFGETPPLHSPPLVVLSFLFWLLHCSTHLPTLRSYQSCFKKDIPKSKPILVSDMHINIKYCINQVFCTYFFVDQNI